MKNKTYTHTLGGKTFSVELNDWAEQAHGSLLVRLGETLVLATAVMNPVAREGSDFFPLTVDYEEKFYATGKILGSRFVKRETRPSEEAILISRLIDRSIRPRFDHYMRNEVQVITTVLSIDGHNDPDIIAMLGASLALALSPIPWAGPIAGVRVGLKNGEKILNPTYEERLEGMELEVVFSGTSDRINMIEAGAHEVTEEAFADAVAWGHEYLKELIAFQKEVIEGSGVKKATIALRRPPEELRRLIKESFSARIATALYQDDKQTAKEALHLVKEEWSGIIAEQYAELFTKQMAEALFDEEINDIIHERIIRDNLRPDGRKAEDIRSLRAFAGVLPRTHGSGLFMRGETHVLSSLTLGGPGDQQIIEGMETRGKRRFLHHYNFPPYSTGETKPMRGPGRREIGHGALAGRALLPLIPPAEEFPYTIRIVSEVLSSNGSSSMASVCGSSLALMDAGVPIKKHAAGAAMGLIINDKGEYRVLTDIQGPEDHHGDMDFKVAGTRDGVNAVQMDVKIDGITHEILKDTLAHAHRARMKILDCMEELIKVPNPDLKPWAPRIQTLKINPEKIGALIGPGGKVINEIIGKTGVQIDIEEDGTVFLTSEKEEGMALAISLVKQVTREVKAGEIFEGRITRILDFGAMVEIGPRQDGLVHVSELAPWRVERVTDIVNIGDVIPVKVKNIDEQGRVNLSLKDVPGRYDENSRPPQREEGEGDRRPPSHSGGDHRPSRPFRR